MREQFRKDVENALGALTKIVGDGWMSLDRVKEFLQESQDSFMIEMSGYLEEFVDWYSGSGRLRRQQDYENRRSQ